MQYKNQLSHQAKLESYYITPKRKLWQKKDKQVRTWFKKVYEKDLIKINERMKGWTVDHVDSGSGENVFIFSLSKGESKRNITLCANDLGGWVK